MKIEIQYLKKSDVNVDYINSLNSESYMRFSRNVGLIYSTEKQLQYIDDFDFSSSFILAIHDKSKNCLIGTSTFYVDETSKVINIGLLIFEKYSGRGIGTIAMKEIIKFIESFFPYHTLEIGTDLNHKAMIKIAESNGFKYQYKDVQKIFYRKENVFTRNLQILYQKEIIVVCNDAGGAASIASLLRMLNIQPEGIVTGPAISVFEKLKVKYREIDIHDTNFPEKLLIMGSSIYGGNESLALEDPRFENNIKIVILDHWMNYRERFNKNGKVLPNQFWVTNNLAYELASQVFHETPVELIPDSQLALIRRTFHQLQGSRDVLLLIWEYQTQSEESLKFPIGLINTRIGQLERFCIENAIAKIIVRLHPSQSKEDFESDITLLQIDNVRVEISQNESLETDLANSVAVVGFSSTALYIASELGIPTYSFYRGFSEHWTNYFSNIKQLDY